MIGAHLLSLFIPAMPAAGKNSKMSQGFPLKPSQGANCPQSRGCWSYPGPEVYSTAGDTLIWGLSHV